MSALPESLDLMNLLATNRWGKGVSIVVRGSMRAQVRDGSVDLVAGWGAEIYLPGKRKPLVTLVSDTDNDDDSDAAGPADLFKQLAALTTEGEVAITRQSEASV